MFRRIRRRRPSPRALVLVTLLLAYGVMYPADVQAVVAPIGALLALTQQVALGAYLLLATLVVCATWRRVRRWEAGCDDPSRDPVGK